MEWICRDCGHVVSATDEVLAITIGWTALDGDTGVCPICSIGDRSVDSQTLGGEPARRRQITRRLVAATHARVAKARRPRWDQARVDAVAKRLGFVATGCLACGRAGDAECANCEGSGEVWRRGSITIGRADLLRLGMLPADRNEG
jgi:hypothetical protein